MDNLNDLLAAQNKRILTLQLLVEALVDELIETKKVKEEKLDARFISKMEWAQTEYSQIKWAKLKFGIVEKKLYICILIKTYGIFNWIFTNNIITRIYYT
jgi:hypothetical protein